jgi:hypothetical protein
MAEQIGSLNGNCCHIITLKFDVLKSYEIFMFLRHLEKTTDNIITRVITISRVKVSIHLPVTAGEIR